MINRNLENRLTDRLERLEYDFDNYSFESFVECVVQHIQRSIEFIPLGMPIGVFGAWIRDPQAHQDFVFFEASLSKSHAEHTKLHEICHIICGHKTLEIDVNEISQFVQQGSLSDALLRSNAKDSEAEQEAETMAFLIQQKIVQNKSQDSDDNSPGTDYLRALDVI